MRMTEEGLALIKRFEGYRGKAYRDATGIWTIGYGHTSMAGAPAVAGGLEITREQASEILARDVATFTRDVKASLRVELSDRQFSALVSFAYNVGTGNFRGSSVLKAVNAGDLDAVPRRLQLWTKAGGRVLPGLVKRRAAEAQMFLDASSIDGPPPPVEKLDGKPLHKSTTSLAAVVSALAGIASTLLGTARETAGVFGGGGMAIVAVVIMIAAAAWIIRERRIKSQDEGV